MPSHCQQFEHFHQKLLHKSNLPDCLRLCSLQNLQIMKTCKSCGSSKKVFDYCIHIVFKSIIVKNQANFTKQNKVCHNLYQKPMRNPPLVVSSNFVNKGGMYQTIL